MLTCEWWSSYCTTGNVNICVCQRETYGNGEHHLNREKLGECFHNPMRRYAEPYHAVSFCNVNKFLPLFWAYVFSIKTFFCPLYGKNLSCKDIVLLNIFVSVHINANIHFLGQHFFVNTTGLDFMLKMSCSDRREICTHKFDIHTNIPLWEHRNIFNSSSSSPMKGSSVSFDPWSESERIQAGCLRPLSDPLPTKPMEVCQASSGGKPEVAPDQHSGWWLSILLWEESSFLTSSLSNSKPWPLQIQSNVQNNILVKASFHNAPQERIEWHKSTLR